MIEVDIAPQVARADFRTVDGCYRSFRTYSQSDENSPYKQAFPRTRGSCTQKRYETQTGRHKDCIPTPKSPGLERVSKEGPTETRGKVSYTVDYSKTPSGTGIYTETVVVVASSGIHTRWILSVGDFEQPKIDRPCDICAIDATLNPPLYYSGDTKCNHSDLQRFRLTPESKLLFVL